jgi:hypothetical protein
MPGSGMDPNATCGDSWITSHMLADSMECVYSQNPLSHVWLKTVLIICDRLGKNKYIVQ